MENLKSFAFIEAQDLQFLGLKEQNEYIVEKYFISTQIDEGITYVKVKYNILHTKWEIMKNTKLPLNERVNFLT